MDKIDRKGMKVVSGGNSLELMPVNGKVELSNGETIDEGTIVSYNNEKLGIVKDFVRGFDDLDSLSKDVEKWEKRHKNLTKGQICQKFFDIYGDKWVKC